MIVALARLRARTRAQEGFTIAETMIALVLIFGVALGLLGALSTGVKGVVLGRQRQTATQLANAAVEEARALKYEQVGHDLSTPDPTLSGDPLITGTAPNLIFNGEPIVGVPSPGPAFNPRRTTIPANNVTYTRWVYVTQITPAAGQGDPYKRVTVRVGWNQDQFGATSGIATSLTVSSLFFNAPAPADPLLKGVVDADSAKLQITGTLLGVDLSDATTWLPSAHGDLDSGFIKTARGSGSTGRSELNLITSSGTGCGGTSGAAVSCAGTTAVTGADNDVGTPQLAHEAVGPANDAGGTVSSGSRLSITQGTGSASSGSTSRSCTGCPLVGDNDNLSYQNGSTTGPASVDIPFKTQGGDDVKGSLMKVLSGCAANCAKEDIDVDQAGSNPQVTSTGSVSIPAIDLVRLNGAPSGYNGFVRIGAASATVSARAGQGVCSGTGTAVTGPAFNVQAWDTTDGSPGYNNFSVTPGTSGSQSAHADLVIDGANVTLDVTGVARPTSTTWDCSGGSTREAQASLTDWLELAVHVVVVDGGTTKADLWLTLDYQRVAAQASFEPAP